MLEVLGYKSLDALIDDVVPANIRTAKPLRIAPALGEGEALEELRKLASENKVLVHPASADSIPTSANQEDHVSMGSISARTARRVLEHVEQIVAIELIAAAQGLDLRLDMSPGTKPGVGVAEAHARVRAVVPRLEHDREPGPDLAAAAELVRSGALVDLALAPTSVETGWLGPDPR